MITVDEFKQAVMNSCVGRKYDDFPQAMKAFIETNFRMIDINSDGVIGIEEYRYDCVQRIVIDDIKIIDDAFDSLLSVSTYLTSRDGRRSTSRKINFSVTAYGINMKCLPNIKICEFIVL